MDDDIAVVRMDDIMNGQPTEFVTQERYEETVKALCGARPVLSIDQDLELVEQGIKTRKPVQYGKKVVVKK